MSRFLSEENIELLENFIATNNPNSSDFLPCISEKFRDDAIRDWESINDNETLPTTYLQFADSANGMTSYGFYKTRDGQIFLITAFCCKLTSYHNVTPTWHILIPRDKLFDNNDEENE